MDIRKMTAGELLAVLKERFFKDIDIESVSSMGVEQGIKGTDSLIFFSKKFVNSHNKLYLCSVLYNL